MVSPFAAAALFLALAFAVPGLLLTGLAEFTGSYTVLFPVALILISAFFLTAIARSGEPRFISVTFWIFSYVFLGISPLLQLASGEFAWEETFSYEVVSAGYLVIGIGIAGFLIGNRSHLLWATATPDRQPTPVAMSTAWAVMLFLISVGTIAAVGSVLGFEELVILPRDDTLAGLALIAEEDSVVLLLIFTITRLPLFIVAITMTAYAMHAKSLHGTYFPVGPAGRLTAVVFVTSWILTLLMSNPVNTARYLVGSIYLSAFLVVLHARWQPRRAAPAIFFIILMLLLIFPLIDVFRVSLDDISVIAGVEELVAVLVTKGDFDAAQQIFAAVQYVREYGLSYGHQLLGTLLFWVPRAFWPTKPQPTGVLLADAAGYDFTNLSSPLWAEALVDFGLVGVLIVFVLYGKFVSILETAYLSTLQSAHVHFVSLFVPIYAAYQIFLLRGTLMSSFAYLVPFILLLVLILKRDRSAPRSTLSEPALHHSVG